MVYGRIAADLCAAGGTTCHLPPRGNALFAFLLDTSLSLAPKGVADLHNAPVPLLLCSVCSSLLTLELLEFITADPGEEILLMPQLLATCATTA